MKAIVGKPFRRTPVFSGTVTYLVLNPSWYVPDNIAKLDLLPKIKSDKEYLQKQKIKVLKGWGETALEVNADTIDWKQITVKNLPFRFQQDPGPFNALGTVKFMFPNKFNVYLHDTPAKELFLKTSREFSSGCIRIEKPLELAHYLLKDQPQWTYARLEKLIKEGTEQTVKIPKPIPIYLLYWTVWVDEQNHLQFRKDIYSRDQALIEALMQKE